MAQILEKLSVESLAAKLGIPKSALYDLAKDAPRLYHEVSIPKKDGGERTLEIPHPILKNLQKRLLENILHTIPNHPNIYGNPGTSPKTAVKEHTKKELVLVMDIADFFPSTKSAWIKNMLKENGANDDVAGIITRLTTYKRHLPQGAPTSSCISRLMLRKFAIALDIFLKRIPYSAFSIWADDITISGPVNIKHAKSMVRKILSRHGYNIKKSKTYVMGQKVEQISLNIRLNEGIEAPSKFLDEIRELEKQLPSQDKSLFGKKSWVKYLKK